LLIFCFRAIRELRDIPRSKKQQGAVMREREMRQRVERFLQTRLRSMLLPATLGLGLAIGACNSDALNADDGGDQTAKKDSGSAAMKYMAQIPEAGPELPAATPDYMAPIPADSGVVLRYMAQMPADAAPEVQRVVALYMAQLPVPRT
jgi:hypothetical protein